jgi:tetratricopeptide (TPR) repeat protein
MRARSKIATYVVSAILILSLCCTTTYAGRHAFTVGEKLPEFSGTNLKGQTFTYKHNQKKALLVMFLSPGHERSARAVEDINNIISQLGTNAKHLQTVIAIDKQNNLDLSSIQKNATGNVHVLLDSEYKLWGKFGIIAVPTVVISDANDNVICIKAGHGYDFAPVVKAYVNQALGLTQNKNPEEAGRVETVANYTIEARIKRHLRMARMLEQKDRIESAIAEIQKARELNPESAEVALELGELLCRAGKSKEALEVTQSLKVTKQIDKARLLLVSGWAKHQLGDLDEAEKLLFESTTLDPKSSRAFFELGNVYQSQQQTEKAMKAYHKALTIIFSGVESITDSH